MPCFAFTKYSPQYVNALQFSCALLLSKTYAIALLYYFVLNATKLTKNLLLFAKLLYSTCAVQPNLTKNMPQLCNSVLHRTIWRLRIHTGCRLGVFLQRSHILRKTRCHSPLVQAGAVQPATNEANYQSSPGLLLWVVHYLIFIFGQSSTPRVPKSLPAIATWLLKSIIIKTLYV